MNNNHDVDMEKLPLTVCNDDVFKIDDYSHFLFYFLRDQNSQHFNEDLLGVNASPFTFVLCFKAADYQRYTGASSYVISAN